MGFKGSCGRQYKNKYPVFPTHRSLSLTMSPLLANGLRYAVENGMKCATACAGLMSILVVYMVLSRPGRGDIIRTLRGPPSPSWIFGLNSNCRIDKPH
jgi:hypothetical protein